MVVRRYNPSCLSISDKLLSGSRDDRHIVEHPADTIINNNRYEMKSFIGIPYRRNEKL
jgi:hypothetical protein